ncbi:hypothetical protein PENTCL1PPCAC_7644, partial [Pristionchus entomophagus]
QAGIHAANRRHPRKRRAILRERESIGRTSSISLNLYSLAISPVIRTFPVFLDTFGSEARATTHLPANSIDSPVTSVS